MKKAKKILIFFITGFLLVSLHGNSQAANFADDISSWSQISAGGPTARRGHTAVYDSSSNSMIVFGGLGDAGDGYKNDVWKLDLNDNKWTEINDIADTDKTKDPDGFPNPRATHSAVWTGNDMVIFGGWNHAIEGAVYRDVWILKNALTSPNPQWQRKGLAPASVDGVRASSAVWTGTKMIIFGGLSDDDHVFNRVMSYEPNSNSWTSNFIGGIDVRYEHSAVYDSASDAMYVFGGRGTGHAVRNDVWKLSNANSATNSASWSKLIDNSSSTQPSRRAGHSAFFDSGNNQMIIFGGITSGGNLSSDVWALKMSGLAWTRVSPSGTTPGIRTDQAGIYDGADDIIIFGGDKRGAGNYGDTWKLGFSPQPVIPITDPPTITDFETVCTWSNISSITLYWNNHAGGLDEYKYYYTRDGGSEVAIELGGASLDERGFMHKMLTAIDFDEGAKYTFRIGHSADTHVGPLTASIQLPMCSPSLRVVPKEGMPLVDIGDDTYVTHAGVDPLKFLAFRDVDGSDTSFEEYDATLESFTSWYENSDPLDIIQVGNDWDGTSYCTDAAPMVNFEKSCVRNNFSPHPNGKDGEAKLEAKWISSMTLNDVITLQFSNQAPVATDFSISTNEDTAIAVNLKDYNGDGNLESYDLDAHDEDSLTYAIVTGPTKGSLSGSGNTRTYTPNSNYSGLDSFTYKVTDRHDQDSNIATVNINVVAFNDPPIANAGSDKSTTLNGTVSFSDATASDPEGNPLTYSWLCTSGSVSPTNQLNPTYTAPGSVGSSTCTLTVNDGSLSASDSLVVTVSATNQAPVAVAGISKDTSSFTSSITVTKGVSTDFYLAAWRGTEGSPTSKSDDPDGWSNSNYGMDSGSAKCEWDLDLVQNAGSFNSDTSRTKPSNFAECSDPDNNASNYILLNKTFNDSPGTYTYYVMKMTDRGNAVSSIATVEVVVQNPALGVVLKALPDNAVGAVSPQLENTITGSATGLANIKFNCNDPEPSDNIWQHSYSNANAVDLTLNQLVVQRQDDEGHVHFTNTIPALNQFVVWKFSDPLCDYTAPGTYYPRVRVERGGESAEAVATVVVTPVSPDFSITTMGPTGPNNKSLPANVLIEPTNNKSLSFFDTSLSTYISELSNFAGKYKIEGANGFTGTVSGFIGYLKKCLSQSPVVGIYYKCDAAGLAIGGIQSAFSKAAVSPADSDPTLIGKLINNANYFDIHRGELFSYEISGNGSPGTRYSSPSLFAVNSKPKPDFVFATNGLQVSIKDGDSDGDLKATYDPDDTWPSNPGLNFYNFQEGKTVAIAAVEFDYVNNWLPSLADKFDKCFVDTSYVDPGWAPANCDIVEASMPVDGVTWTYNYVSPATYNIGLFVADALMGYDKKVRSVDVFNPVNLNVSINGNGKIESADGFINCDPNGVDGIIDVQCGKGYTPGAAVVLNATPKLGSTHGLWGGSCVGTPDGSPCNLTMNIPDKNVSKNFNTPSLTIEPVDLSTLRQTQTRKFTAKYDDGSGGPVLDVTDSVTWSVSDLSGNPTTVISIVSPAGTIQADNRGLAQVSANYAGVDSGNKPQVKVIKYKWEEK